MESIGQLAKQNAEQAESVAARCGDDTVAATKIQARHRGQQGRKKAHKKGMKQQSQCAGEEPADSGGSATAAPQDPAAELATWAEMSPEQKKAAFDEQAAAVKIQAQHRGKQVRMEGLRHKPKTKKKDPDDEHHDTVQAATRIQARQRGKTARRRPTAVAAGKPSGQQLKAAAAMAGAEGRPGARMQTLLHQAARSDQPAVVAWLAAQGAGLETADGDGRTPLQVSCDGWHVRSIRAILQAGGRMPHAPPPPQTLDALDGLGISHDQVCAHPLVHSSHSSWRFLLHIQVLVAGFHPLKAPLRYRSGRGCTCWGWPPAWTRSCGQSRPEQPGSRSSLALSLSNRWV